MMREKIENQFPEEFLQTEQRISSEKSKSRIRTLKSWKRRMKSLNPKEKKY